jgi:hypothetical protein
MTRQYRRRAILTGHIGNRYEDAPTQTMQNADLDCNSMEEYLMVRESNGLADPSLFSQAGDSLVNKCYKPHLPLPDSTRLEKWCSKYCGMVKCTRCISALGRRV